MKAAPEVKDLSTNVPLKHPRIMAVDKIIIPTEIAYSFKVSKVSPEISSLPEIGSSIV
jgi:hypothetical protein